MQSIVAIEQSGRSESNLIRPHTNPVQSSQLNSNQIKSSQVKFCAPDRPPDACPYHTTQSTGNQKCKTALTVRAKSRNETLSIASVQRKKHTTFGKKTFNELAEIRTEFRSNE